MALGLNVMKLFVINLDRSPERLDRLKAIFATMKLDFMRVPAIDGANLSEQKINELQLKSQWIEPLTRGEVACFLSHYEALKLIANGCDEYGAIFEDDAMFSKDASLLLSSTDWILPQADIVKIETQGKKIWLGEAIRLNEKFTLSQLKTSNIMAAGYIISKKASIRLLDLMDQTVLPFDHLLFNPQFEIFKNFTIMQLDPAIMKQANLTSTLEKDRAINKNFNKAKRSPWQIFLRELKRVITRSKTGLWGLYINYLTRQSWKRIKFQSDDN